MYNGARTFIILIVVCLLGISPAVSGGDDPPAFISGTVTDEQTGEPIINVNVFIMGTRIGAITDDHGRFSLGPLKHGIQVIEFSHIAYVNVRDLRHIEPGETLRYDVRLTEQSIILEEVEVVAEPTLPAHLWVGPSGRVFTREDIEKTGARRLSDVLRVMAPRAHIVEVGPDLYIDLNSGPGRNVGYPFRGPRHYSNPLVILNGMRIGKSPIALNFMIKTEEIDVIAVLRGIEADMYGYEGRDGVLLIETTPQPQFTGLSFYKKLLYTSMVVGVSFLFSWLVFL